MLTGLSFSPPLLKWALVTTLSSGPGFFTLTFTAPSLSLVTPVDLALSSLRVECVKAVPCPPFCMFSPWKCWLLTSAVILILLVCASLVFLLSSLYCPCMLMTRPPFRALIATRAIFSVCGLFEQCTSAKLNLGKCEGVWLGS